MQHQDSRLLGCRVLVVEDELLVAMDVENFLMDEGLDVLPLASTVPEAMTSISEFQPQLVILDRNLHGESTTPVAEELNRRSTPFIVVTGYVRGGADDPAMARAPCVRKPWREEELLPKIINVLGI